MENSMYEVTDALSRVMCFASMSDIQKEIKISSGRRGYVKIRGIASTMNCVQYCDNNIRELQELFNQNSVVNILLLIVTYRRTTCESTLSWHGISLAGYRILSSFTKSHLGTSSRFCQDSRIVLISQAEDSFTASPPFAHQISLNIQTMRR